MKVVRLLLYVTMVTCSGLLMTQDSLVERVLGGLILIAVMVLLVLDMELGRHGL